MVSPLQVIGAVVISWEGTISFIFTEWVMQTSLWTTRRAWLIWTCIFIFAAGLATVGFAIFPFAWELGKEAAIRTVHVTYGTTVWTIFRDIAVVMYVAIKIRNRWGKEEVGKYLKTAKDAAEAIAVAFLLTFVYHLAVTIPNKITTEATNQPAPPLLKQPNLSPPLISERIPPLPPSLRPRSHIHITGFNWTVPDNAGGHAEVKVNFINDGNLPIEAQTSVAHMAFHVAAELEDIAARLTFQDSLFRDVPEDDPINTPAAFMIPIGSDRGVVVSSSTWSEEAVKKFMKGGAAVYVAGVISYSDKNSLCRTTYCAYVENTGQHTYFCNKHNEEPKCK